MNNPVNFELAKLLSEKGFDENCRFGYNGSFEPHHIGLIEFGYLQRNSELLELIYSAPTIAEVVMWIYEKHFIWIWTERYSSMFRPYAEEFGNRLFGKWEGFKYNSPTEAYEVAILYVLRKLI